MKITNKMIVEHMIKNNITNCGAAYRDMKSGWNNYLSPKRIAKIEKLYKEMKNR